MPLTRRLYASSAALLLAAVVAISLPATAQDKSAKVVAAALKPFVTSHALAGAITLVADKDKVLSLSAVGYSDVATKTPLKTDALVWIASQSKPITAAALMILVDEGKVKLDEPAETYLPELKALKVKEKVGDKVELRKPSRPVTVRHLLSHTSGMPFRSPAEQPTLDKLTLKAGIESYATTPLDADPGTRYAYSNAGINTAGRIIEVVSEMPYEDFLDKRLFGPLGMTDTTFWPTGEKLARVAKAYKPDAAKKDLVEIKIDQLRYPLDDRTRQPMPAGGLFSTATDVAKFCQMLLNGGTLNGKRVLSEAAVKEMTTRQTPKELKESYGLGLSVGGSEFGHGGALSTNMTVDTKHGLVFVWLVQHAGYPGNGGQAQEVFRDVSRAMFSDSK
jgi:CubicO group peptidase (beta-lactamase class C family)